MDVQEAQRMLTRSVKGRVLFGFSKIRKGACKLGGMSVTVQAQNDSPSSASKSTRSGKSPNTNLEVASDGSSEIGCGDL